MTTDESIGARIREQRKRLNLTRPELAARLGTTATSLYRWESGRQHVSIESLVQIARELGIPPSSLLDGVR